MISNSTYREVGFELEKELITIGIGPTRLVSYADVALSTISIRLTLICLKLVDNAFFVNAWSTNLTGRKGPLLYSRCNIGPDLSILRHIAKYKYTKQTIIEKHCMLAHSDRVGLFTSKQNR